jgi:chaperone BCS1
MEEQPLTAAATNGAAAAVEAKVPEPSSGVLSTLSNNPYFNAGFGLVGIGLVMTLLRRGVMQAGTLARRRLLVTLEIPSRDKSYPWFLHWMTLQSGQRRSPHLAVETWFKQHENGAVSTEFALVPGPGKHLFRWQGAWMQVSHFEFSGLSWMSRLRFTRWIAGVTVA